MKKIVFITREGGDWGMDLLFSGLAQIYGHENMIVFPFREKYREGIPKLIGHPEKDWGAERRSLGYAKGYQDLREYNHSQTTGELRAGNVDYIFVDERDQSYGTWLTIRGQFWDVPVVVVAAHDSFQNTTPEHVKSLYGKNFKMLFTDCVPLRKYGDILGLNDEHSWIKRYSWSINFDHLWDSSKREELLKNKVYDLCFMGYNSNPDRAKFVDHILKKWGHLNNHIVLERQGNTFDKFVPKSEYFTKMAQSKICINFRGDARNGKALRFWEIPYVGSYMLSQDFEGMFTMRPKDKGWYPEPGVHYGKFETTEDFDRVVEHSLNNMGHTNIIANCGHSLFMDEYTSKGVVEGMLRELNG